VGRVNVKPVSVLIVDDDQPVARVLERFFVREGHRVELAYTGAEALALLERTRFELCLVDKNLPDASGVAIAQTARERCPDAVIILLTGYASAGSAAELIGVADEYLTKPFELELLRETVETLLLRRATRFPPAEDAPAKSAVQAYVLATNPDDAELLSFALSSLEVSFEVGTELPMLAPSLLVMAGSLASFSVRRAIWNWQTTARLRLVMLVDPQSISDTIAAVALGATFRIRRPATFAQAREVLKQAL